MFSAKIYVKYPQSTFTEERTDAGEYTDDPSVMLQMVEMIYAVYSDNGNMAGSTRQKLHDEIAYWRAEKEKREMRRSSTREHTCGV